MTLEQLEIFKAVVSEGSFRAAADKLWKTQPAISIAIKKLEKEFNLVFFDRQNYRATLTESGKAFYEKCKDVLFESKQLKDLGNFLSKGEEPFLKISINIVSPVPQLLSFVRDFFEGHPNTEPEIYFDVLKGSVERLDNEEVDISFSAILPNETDYEKVFLTNTTMIPVTAPGFLPLDNNGKINDRNLKRHTQIIVADSSKKREDTKYHVLSGSKSWTVNSMHVKKEILLAGMGWGTLPSYMIQNELEKGLLIPVKNKNIPNFEIAIYALRLKNRIHGQVAEKLWKNLTNFEN